MKSPQLRQVDLGVEFAGSVTKKIEKHKTNIRRGRTEIHRDQAIVKRYNRNLAKRLLGHQYAVEKRLPRSHRYSEWVVWLPVSVSALSGEVTRLSGKKPVAAGFELIKCWEHDFKERPLYPKKKKETFPHAIAFDIEASLDTSKRKQAMNDLLFESEHVPMSV